MKDKHEIMAKREEEKAKDKIVVLDFGGQYSHLIVRRCRELGVYTELFPFDVPLETLKQGLEQNEGAGKLRGIILSGSPFGVHEFDSPRCSSEIVDLNVPLLGICYGAQLIAVLECHAYQIPFSITISTYDANAPSHSANIAIMLLYLFGFCQQAIKGI
jgi:carbamoylphosphate synthase small subunit